MSNNFTNRKENIISIVITLFFVLGFLILVNYNPSITGLSTLDNLTLNETFDFGTEAVICNVNLSSCKTSGWSNNTIYCLNQDITDATAHCMVIDNNSVTLNCRGFNITGDRTSPPNDYGVYVDGYNYTTIKNCKVYNFHYGVYLSHANYSTIFNNTADNNSYYGFYLQYSSYNNLTNNLATNHNNQGFDTRYSSFHNIFTNNTANDNRLGFYHYLSQNSTLTNNILYNNTYNFNVWGGYYSHLDNNIDTTNTVDGKPIYYIKNAANTEYDSSTNAGVFYCIQCNNVTIKDLNLTKNRYGIFFWNTTNSSITNINSSYNDQGILLDDYSSYNNITSNIITNNGEGIFLDDDSSYNNIINNTVYNNDEGISLASTSYNNIINNLVYNNYEGIYLDTCSYNNIINNTVYNSDDGIYLDTCSYNNITNNTANNNEDYGIYIRGFSSSSSSNNLINFNTANNNSQYGVYIHYHSSNNTIVSNIINNNSQYGIYIYNNAINNAIYNNYFNNTINAKDDTSGNYWNTTKTAGTNIINGSYIGGNYWSDYTGVDTSRDEIGDTGLPYNSGGDITNGGDYLPLVYPFPIVDLQAPINNTNSSTPYINFTYNVTDADSNIDSCILWLNKQGIWELNSTNWTITETINQTFNITVEDTNLLWRIECNDTLDNRGNSTTYNLTVDATGPEIDLLYPSNDSSFTDFWNINFTYNATTISGIKNCTLFLNIDSTGYTNITHDVNIEKDVNQTFNKTFQPQTQSIVWKVGCYSNLLLPRNSSEYDLILTKSSAAAGTGSTSSGIKKISKSQTVIPKDLISFVEFNNPNIPITSIELQLNKEAELQISVKRILASFIDQKLENAYSYFVIETNLDNSYFDYIKLSFKVKKNYEDIELYQLSDKDSYKIDATKIYQDKNYNYYQANINSLGYFAITAESIKEIKQSIKHPLLSSELITFSDLFNKLINILYKILSLILKIFIILIIILSILLITKLSINIIQEYIVHYQRKKRLRYIAFRKLKAEKIDELNKFHQITKLIYKNIDDNNLKQADKNYKKLSSIYKILKPKLKKRDKIKFHYILKQLDIIFYYAREIDSLRKKIKP